jgi:hypothetical protein
MPIGMGLGGVIADALNRDLVLVFFLCGICSLIPVPLLAINRQFHKFIAHETREAGAANTTI